MTITIPVYGTQDADVSGPYIDITPEIARQTVALGLDGISPKTLAAIDQGMADSLAGRVTPFLGEAHQAQLEQAHDHDCNGGLNEPCDCTLSIRRNAEQEAKQWVDRLVNIKRCEMPSYLIEIKKVQAQRDLHLAQATTISRMHDEAMAERDQAREAAESLRAALGRVTQESEARRARVAELEKDNKDLNDKKTLFCQQSTSFSDEAFRNRCERDRALASVKELEAKLAMTQHDRAEQQRVAMESEKESIALRARVAELEQHNKDLAIAVQKYGDDLAAERERADEWKAACDRHTVQAEKLRDELAALKGRKVKLPTMRYPGTAYNEVVNECADAIRAAGVEVADE